MPISYIEKASVIILGSFAAPLNCAVLSHQQIRNFSSFSATSLRRRIPCLSSYNKLIPFVYLWSPYVQR